MTIVQGDGPHGSRMGPPEGARTVVLSSNGTIYLIVLSCLLGFFNCVSMACRPYGPPDMRWGGGRAVPLPPRCATGPSRFELKDTVPSIA